MIAIIVAAGSSRRMGFDKLTADLGGLPVLARSLQAFEACAPVTKIVLVARQDRVAEFGDLARKYRISKLDKVVAGGGERHLSVWKGFEAAEPGASDLVAVHDAARPLISPRAITGCMELARQHGGAACASPIADTLKRATPEGLVSDSVDRDHLWAMQTPQIFLASVLEQAYKPILRTGGLVTDEVSAVQRLGILVALYHNEEPNFKITLRQDLELARLVLATLAARSSSQ